MTSFVSPHPRVAFEAAGRRLEIEHRFVDGPAHDPSAPLVVFLHEGLGSASMWRDFPDRLCAAGGLRGLVFSRPGYGASTPRAPDEHWGADFMQRQAIDVLPPFFAALGIDVEREPPWLFGHSDGGSIALIHAATYPTHVAGIVAVAPHLDVERFGVDEIAKTRVAYLETDLRGKLARHHADVDSAFWGWNDVWLSAPFSHFDIHALLPAIRCPVLAIQGCDDQYGTMRHIDGIRDALPATTLLRLERCAHSPHRDRPDDVIAAATGIIHDHGGSAARRPVRAEATAY
jgi:pimeloyl-ACP methyl ester carboxylesterase